MDTINQYSYCIAEKNSSLKEALNDSNILLPDGVGVTGAFFFLNGIKVKKIPGADLYKFLLKKLNTTHGSCFYLDAFEETLVKIKDQLKLEFPNISVGSYKLESGTSIE